MTNYDISVSHLTHRYGDRTALNDVSFTIPRGEIFGLLGPNGGGKTTMFKILSTLIRHSEGTAEVCGFNVRTSPSEVRKHIGVVFQSPSLDQKLTVKENLHFQGILYGLHGQELMRRIDDVLLHLNLSERAHDEVEKLSGGQQRRVEVGKGLLHYPDVLILDEPSTGLDPGARIDLWQYLLELNRSRGITIVVTTHILDEAEHCNRLAILDQGNLVALGTPAELKREIGGDIVSVIANDPENVHRLMKEKFGNNISVVEKTIRMERENAHRFVPQLIEAFPGQIESVSISKPTLEDVFIHRTGHRLWNEEANGESK
ncbi:MAG: ABC transporter ATP-binding protein [Bacteroidota bacterium]|nr:ABC transporter ATP-binding protein [Bacteroidota bacterium]